MGRKRQRVRSVEKAAVVVEEPDVEVTREKKRHKKGKHKKRKVKEEVAEEEEEPIPRPTKKPLTLKIKFGNEVLTTDCKPSISEEIGSSSLGDSGSLKSSQVTTPTDEWGVGGAGSDEISVGEESLPISGDLEGEREGEDEEEEELNEEEAWLDALESGTVDNTGYLPQKKDPRLLTTRQRALIGSEEVEYLELPLKKRKKEETEEMILKKTERNRKRRIQAIKRREKHKAETVHKLLHKQTNKKSEEDKNRSGPKTSGPHLRYVDSSSSGVSISLTAGLSYPLEHSTAPKPPLPVRCTVVGCTNPKKYSDSATKLPLCSLECYKILKQQQQQQQPLNLCKLTTV